MKTISFSAMWNDKLREAIDKRSLEPYPMEFHRGQEWDAIVKAINQGIDSHLQAVEFKQSIGEHGRNKIVVSPATLSVLVRRLVESQDETAESLASSICGTLEIELI